MKKKEEKTIAVMCRFTRDEVDYMKAVTLARCAATAINIYCRKHILSERKRRSA